MLFRRPAAADLHCPRAGAESEGGDSRRVGVGPDVSIRAQIINLMLDLQREMGIAFLFISHDMAVVERISHRVAVMYRGRIVEIGPRRAVFENPQHPYTRKLMAAVPVADLATVIRSGFCCLMTSRQYL